jgi:hypothetical protein
MSVSSNAACQKIHVTPSSALPYSTIMAISHWSVAVTPRVRPLCYSRGENQGLLKVLWSSAMWICNWQTPSCAMEKVLPQVWVRQVAVGGRYKREPLDQHTKHSENFVSFKHKWIWGGDTLSFQHEGCRKYLVVPSDMEWLAGCQVGTTSFLLNTLGNTHIM